MAKLKREEEEVIIETPVEETVVEETPVNNTSNSEAKEQFKLHIEAYAKASPAKYELKKEALLAKLNTL